MPPLKESVENCLRMERCPDFDTCAAPKCPLDEMIGDRTFYSKEPKCTLSKEERYIIGRDMKHCGMSPGEWRGYLKIFHTEDMVRKRLEQEYGGK